MKLSLSLLVLAALAVGVGWPSRTRIPRSLVATVGTLGAIGLLWAAMWVRWYRDDPAEHPAVYGLDHVEGLGPAAALLGSLAVHLERSRARA